MTDLSKCKVTFTPPDYNSMAVLDTLLRVITGKHGEEFIRDVSQNLGGRYDELYDGEINAAE